MLLKLFICKIDAKLLKTVGSEFYLDEQNNHIEKVSKSTNNCSKQIKNKQCEYKEKQSVRNSFWCGQSMHDTNESLSKKHFPASESTKQVLDT